jgi:hypothetical protein
MRTVVSLLAVLLLGCSSGEFSGKTPAPKVASGKSIAKAAAGATSGDAAAKGDVSGPEAAPAVESATSPAATATTAPAAAAAPQVCTRKVMKTFTDGVGVKINSKNHGTDTESQCNTSCHWANQGYSGCATRDCGSGKDDSICYQCIYQKEVDEQYGC